MRSRPSKNNRRRCIYTQNDQRRLLGVGALLIASAATLGYIYGRYAEKHKKHNALLKNTKNEDAKQNCPQIVFERNYRILVYGDSTTWGYCPNTQTRLPSHQRYPCVLRKLLNSNSNSNYIIDVISEGLNGRTISHQDLDGNPKNERRKLSMNGTAQILPILYSHKPIDIIVIMLGINDCKSRFNPSAMKIAESMNALIKECINAEIWPLTSKKVAHGPSILLISPACMTEVNEINKVWTFNEVSMNVSQSLHKAYAKVQLNSFYYGQDVLHFVNANDFIQTGVDSVHINGENNVKLAHALYPKIVSIIHKLQMKARKFSVPSFTSQSLKTHMEQSTLNKLNEEVNEDNDSVISELEQGRDADHVMEVQSDDNHPKLTDNNDASDKCDSSDKKLS